MARTDPSEPVQGPYTWTDFVNLPDGDRRELIDGELVEVEVPGAPHEYVVTKVATELEDWAKPSGGFVFASGFKVYVSQTRGVMPDVQFYATSKPAPPQTPGPRGRRRPDLAVEVISPARARYDRVIKFEYYARIGTPEYWIIDPETSTLDRFLLKDGQYALAASLTGDSVLRPETLPGFELRLGEVWPSTLTP